MVVTDSHDPLADVQHALAPHTGAAPARTLVASYCFPPYSDTAAIVAAKRVREAGEAVDVICNAMDSVRSQDWSLVQIAGDLVRRFAALPTATAFSSWRSVSEYVNVGMLTFQRWEAEQGAYEHLYSRAQFAASHFLAGRIKTERPQIRWRAEFSDPVSHDVLGQPRYASLDADSPIIAHLRRAIEERGFATPSGDNSNQWCETIVFALADEILFTNRIQRDFMISKITDDALADRVRERAVVSAHPTLPREFYGLETTGYRLDSSRANIGYFGNFYQNRGVDLVLQALTELPEASRERLCLHVFTSGRAIDDLTREVQRLRLQRCVRVNGYVGFLEFLNLADQMSVLLVNDAVTPAEAQVNPFLPSKISDYKGSSTPTWAIIEEGSPMDCLSDIAHRSPIGHLSAIRQQLAAFAHTAPSAGGAA